MKKLLYYLDDDVDDLDFFREISEGLGHRVTTFMTGNELLYALKHESEKPNLIFLDVHMPILNGEEILNVIRKSEEYHDIPIVMISCAYPKKLIRHYIEAGANYFMKKSTFNDLKLALEEVLEIDFKNYHTDIAC